MSDRASVLELRRVTKRFPAPAGFVDVLREVDLALLPGEFLMITGTSGSGKTTLLHIAALLEPPGGGRVEFGGRPVDFNNEDEVCAFRRERIGMVFQRFHLLARRSALENVALRFRYARRRGPETQRLAAAALEQVRLGELSARAARLLSAGEMQRVAIARAIAMRPDVLVADEPTGNLDRASAETVMSCFRDLNRRGLTILMVTHNEELLGCATRHLVCRDGRLVPGR